MRLGSLCTGIGGLDLAVEEFFGAELAWCAEIDNDASRVLAARFPGVENIGNFIGRAPEPVDILCAGFPCQPVSQAGRRRGVDDERWLWDDIVDLVRGMDPYPRVLVFENVTGLLRANSGRAFERVAHGLAALGFDARWDVVRASDVGAPHQRARWFCVAAHADGSGLSPKFVEWMMGYPPGWVTDVLVTRERSLFGEVVCPERESQLRVLGNAVVPQQAYVALGELVGWSE